MYFNYDYYGSINLTYFKLITLYSFFLVSISFQPQKKEKYTLYASFKTLGASTETVNNLCVKPIVDSEICILLQFDQYSSD